MYFDIVFSQPFTSSQVITNAGQSDPAAVYVGFDTTSNPVIEVPPSGTGTTTLTVTAAADGRRSR